MKVADPRYYTVPYRTVPECLLNFDMYRCSASSQVKLKGSPNARVDPRENAGGHIHAGAADAERRCGATEAFRKQPCTRAAGLQRGVRQHGQQHGAQLKNACAYECDVFCRCCDAPASESGPEAPSRGEGASAPDRSNGLVNSKYYVVSLDS